MAIRLRPPRSGTGEALAIDLDHGIKGEQVVGVGRVSTIRGAPETIRPNNGPGLIPEALGRWASKNRGALGFGLPGQPTDNAFVKSSNSRFSGLSPSGEPVDSMPSIRILMSVPRSQLGLIHLAHRITRNLRDKNDILGKLETGQPLRQDR